MTRASMLRRWLAAGCFFHAYKDVAIQTTARLPRPAYGRCIDAMTHSHKPDPARESRNRPPGEPRREAGSGRGAESALQHLRAWEQRRASARAAGSTDKPLPD